MEHFGIKLINRKYGNTLTREKYAVVSNKASLPSFCDALMEFENWKYHPKERMIEYFNKMIDYYLKIGINNLNRQQCLNLNRIKEAMLELENYSDISHIENMKKLYDEKKDKKEITEKKYINNKIERMNDEWSNYDFEASIEGKVYSQKWVDNQYKMVMENFDLNMKYFDSLDLNDMNKEIDSFMKKYPKFKEVKNITKYYYSTGYYVLISEKYKQIYVGTSDGIGLRIKQHWHKVKQFDRLLFPSGAVYTSLLSYDSFRALDTSRILICESKTSYRDEDEYVNFFSNRFVANRVRGGKINFVFELAPKKRNLIEEDK